MTSITSAIGVITVTLLGLFGLYFKLKSEIKTEASESTKNFVLETMGKKCTLQQNECRHSMEKIHGRVDDILKTMPKMNGEFKELKETIKNLTLAVKEYNDNDKNQKSI